MSNNVVEVFFARFKRGVVFTVLICFMLAVSGCGTARTESRNLRVTLIAKSSESNFWVTCFQGADAAAVEYTNVTLKKTAPENEWDSKSQNVMISQAVEEHVDAIILSACDYDASAAYVETALDAGIPVVTIDSGVNTERRVTFIGTDNFEAGRMAADAVAEKIGSEGSVGVIGFEKGSANGEQRINGFNSAMEEYPGIAVVEIVNSDSDYDTAQKAAEDMLKKHGEGLTAIATFNELTTVGVARAIAANEKYAGVCVVGFDNNPESIQMLENGVIDCLVVQNSFAMGYLGVERAILETKGGAPGGTVPTRTVLVTKENMYSPDNEKLLFPFSGD
ncbi:MAG TPA: LacI family transcriptional regulator [Ruminococcaceae bacterium]|nr:LacI family transcriptional regulator [Oscillospiraceae bacterium]